MTSMKHITGSLQPIKDHVLVEAMEFGERHTRAGVIIIADDGVDRGIRPRWALVHAVGPQQKNVKVGQYILVSHGRWTRGVDVTNPETNETKTLRRVDNDDILLVSDEFILDETVSNL